MSMSEERRKLLLLGLGAVGLLMVLGVGLYVTTRGQDSQNAISQADPSSDQSVVVEPADVSDNHDADALYISNLSFLAQWFNETEYLFINNASLNFGNENYPAASGYFIDETSFIQNGSEYSFTIRNNQNAKLFYVTVARTEGNQLNISFYKL